MCLHKNGRILRNKISFIYAFETSAPYSIKEKSGYFCLGYGSKDEDRINLYVMMTWARKMTLNNNNLITLKFTS